MQTSFSEGGWSSQPQQQHFSEGQGQQGGESGSGDAQAATVAAMQAGAQTPGQGQGGNAQAQPTGQKNAFLDGIMEQIDPAHRPIVEPYLGKWNAGVTRRFQDLHGELAPYKELGADPETLSEAYQLYQLIDSDPQQVLDILQEAIAEINGGAPPQGVQGQPAPGEQPATELPPEMVQLQERFGTFEKVLEAIAQQVLDSRTSEQEAAEDAELDNYLNLLKTEMGEFDEDFVIAKMMAGTSGEDAVKAYQTAIQGQVNQRARQPNLPPILGGGGAVPQGGQSVTDASRKDTKSLVANILASSQQQ